MDNRFVLSDSFNDLVFENRHKSYGAYQLRKQYGRRVIIAVFTSVFIFTAGIWAYSKLNATRDFFPAEDYSTQFPPEIPPVGNIEQPKIEQPKTKPVRDMATTPKGPVDMKDLTTPQITNQQVTTTITNSDAGKSTNGNEGGTGTGTSGTGAGTCLECPPADTAELKPRLVSYSDTPPTNDELDPFLVKSLKYPTMCKEVGVEGTVWIEFIVDTKGNYRDVKVAKGAHPELNREALRVMKQMPAWKPAKDGGEAVEYLYRKPITFKLRK
jgi:protein TonB